jgi:hypothetical protein
MIDGRAKNQKVTLELYELFNLDANKLRGFANDLQELAGIAFSLWRAVFLADREGTVAQKNADAKEFIGKMLTDNTIAFAQDRAFREWTFNYYLDNALLRLADLGEANLKPPKGSRSADNRWDYLHKAFSRQVKKIARAIEGD